jgi:hypothetical protein
MNSVRRCGRRKPVPLAAQALRERMRGSILVQLGVQPSPWVTFPAGAFPSPAAPVRAASLPSTSEGKLL